MNPSELPIHQPQHRRPANDEMIPSYLDARPGALGVTITNVAAAVKQAYDSGGRVLKLRAGDRAILEREFPGLGGCSRYAYDSILSPLLNVLDTLKGIDGAMENWAFRVKRMNLQRAALDRIYRNNALTTHQKLYQIKDIICNDVGFMNSAYTNTFANFASDLEPTITNLRALHDLLYAPRRALILDNDGNYVPMLSPTAPGPAPRPRPRPRPATSTTGIEPTTAADRVFTRAYYLTKKAIRRTARIHARAHRLGDMSGAMQTIWEGWADGVRAGEEGAGH